jgi:hypothetical protein
MSTHDITKLPKWAQSRIKVLEHDLATYKRRFQRTVDGDTEVFLRAGAFEDDIPLPPKSHVLFKLGGDREIEVRVEQNDDAGFDALYVYAFGFSTRLLFAPRSTNTAYLYNLDLRDMKEKTT